MSPQHSAEPSIRVEARFAQLPALLSYLATVPADIDRETLLRAGLAVEELFANSIHHGYGGECDQPVWLTVGREGGHLHVTYADAAPPFDPFAEDRQRITDGDVDERQVGGLGRLLLKEMATRCTYRHADGRNVIELTYALPRSA